MQIQDPAWHGRRSRRPDVQAETLVLLCALWIMAAGNGPFWRAALQGRSWAEGGTWLLAGAMFTGITAFYVAFTALVASRFTVRPLLALLLLVTAAASYYMDRYAIYLDRAMLRNILATDIKESRELLSWGMALHVAAFGVLPAVLLWWPTLRRRTLGRALAVRAAWVAGTVAVGVASLMLVFADFASLMRNHPDMRNLVTPGNIVAALAGNAWGRAKRPNQPRTVVGADAVLGPAARARTRPSLFVLVVGETARAQNFSLGSYARPTNPRLATRGVVYFPDATSCGTSTEVSLPCMFSPYGRARYDEEKILTTESVLHVLARAGVKVLWRDNQSGCKGVCDGLAIDQLDHASVPGLCADGQCFDEVLLHGMDTVLRDPAGNLLVVMHQLGSHGPAYYRRYPPPYRQFTPACESDDLRLCSAAQIANAYDNTILYTDAFLAKVIDVLAQAQDRYDTGMLYMSDHGESLGEGGLYLHGMPYAIAPDVQTHVPYLLWLSPAMQRGFGIDEACLRKRAGSTHVSHDNLFPSLLGLFGVQTRVYAAGLDLFAPCRTGTSPAATAAAPAAPAAQTTATPAVPKH